MSSRNSKKSDKTKQEALALPKHAKKISSIDEFWAGVSVANHYAVRRSYSASVNLFHHFLIADVRPEAVKVIHYYGTASGFIKSKSTALGSVMELSIERGSTSELLDVDEGLYLIDDPSYRDLGDPQETIKRARQRLGESQYDPLRNNCEHFARWVLTGQPYCEQMECASFKLKTMAALLSEVKNIGERAGLKVGREGVQTAIAFIERAVRSGAPRLLQHRANFTVGGLAGTAGATFGLSLLAELILFIYTVIKQYKLFENTVITKQDFKNGVIKSAITSLMSVIAGTIGGILGQILIPVPLVGGIIGSLVFGVGARCVTAVVYELIVNRCTKQVTSQQCLSLTPDQILSICHRPLVSSADQRGSLCLPFGRSMAPDGCIIQCRKYERKKL